MKNAKTIESSGIAMAFGILLVMAGRHVLDNAGSSYETVLSFSVSAYLLLYAGYMLIGLSLLGFLVAVLKD